MTAAGPPAGRRQGSDSYEIVIVGGGVAGLAMGIELAGAGCEVACIEPSGPSRTRVGESLDWSAPSLLGVIGVEPRDLIEAAAGTLKREVHASTIDGHDLVGRPPRWIGRWPLCFESTTLHVDRRRFDSILWRRALESGVRFIEEEAVDVSREGDRITGVQTRSGRKLVGDWYVDASGRARVLSRSLAVARRRYGEPRIAIWSHVSAPIAVEGTCLYLDTDGPGLRWAWEIPISESCLSVGVVIPATDYQAEYRSTSNEAVLTSELKRYDRFEGFNGVYQEAVLSRGYWCHVSDRVAGENWMLLGEAAAFVDPLTSLGVTAALRTAHEASSIIATRNPRSGERALRQYDRRVRAIADLYNRAINEMLYEPGARQRLGIRKATKAYVVVGFGANALYSRIDPRGTAGTAIVRVVVLLFAFWARFWARPARRRRRR